ncbi:2-dehydro-3-deoxy-D-gluconate 5-dehydrogenase KduD [Aquisalinus flavus]|uniref:2-deoxy-D-gluconate 3-dehydrogenase n=1 Tax=Aquisalinus flavus TaxID=1526572 RepID=A0A8J2Y5R4_9PROT|nr:2-dehydro-3-deoxy-D-gluconate 5-dehydrogenase KduD [Aquisalinus flavus]MBD0427424.1 2-dehydro-3-deoxy-D-gluconate 5-dehydrogenase KduD [Aquisalinus flavus]UNE47227.1 2-dehydro-3-deoxy-D-gluconate 5-dehydrogenase KduD [Aquisalinus flavus]GGD00888.1 2-deoxy-D-gluconate 3-dehydrogenase [Aquisalinus flavus]
MPSFDLSGKTALVTGANTGLGQAIAIALAGAGADIVAAGRSSAAETGKAVAGAGRAFHEVTADFGEPEAPARAIEDAVTAAGQVDILVNNAGIIRRNDALEFTASDWDDVMNVNIRSVFFLCQAFARHVTGRGANGEVRGKIINIASMLSYQGGIRVASYTSSKSGVTGLTRLLANEWAAKGINVNAIAPGYFATNNTEALREDKSRNAEILGRIPAGHWGDPSDLGGAAVFLAASASDYVHGTTLPVDGGWLAR